MNPQNVILTQEMLAQVEQAFNTSTGTLITNVESIPIMQQDLIRLQGLTWLNDNIINAYMQLINRRSEEKENHLQPRVCAFNTFFLQSLSKSGYSKVKKWTKGKNIFSYDMVLIPVHLTNHWCLAVIDFRSKTIKYYDSLGGENWDCLKTLLDYLSQEITDKQQGKLNQDEWRLKCLKDLPQQKNHSDCGVFVCKFADYVARDAPINFTQHDMPYFRKRIAIEILNGKLMEN
ncbi:Ulp1 family isopeptidase [Cardinium endosymbiont of Philonthus spinipes]|uniref:Ulp1 family isopeptidase n=1 Tax=Cardinium endosymbiont of Philonthus spinipes TaxID=3077941 RepID=UPI00313C21E1